MPKPIIVAITELNKVLKLTAIFHAVFESLPVFLVADLVFFLVRLPWWLALLPWLGSLWWCLRKNLAKASLTAVEQRSPRLHEVLRTAADNADKENVVVNALQQDVLGRLRYVMVSDFIKFRKLTRLTVLCAVLVFAVLFSSALGWYVIDAPALAHDVSVLAKARFYPSARLDIPPPPVDDSAIYGNKTILEIGTKELKLQITPLASDLNLDKIKPPEEHQFKEGLPSQIRASQESGFEENIPREQQEIVKAYFSQIVKG